MTEFEYAKKLYILYGYSFELPAQTYLDPILLHNWLKYASGKYVVVERIYGVGGKTSALYRIQVSFTKTFFEELNKEIE